MEPAAINPLPREAREDRTLGLELRRPEDGVVWTELLEALPAAVRATLEGHGGLQERRAIVAERGGRPVALLHGARRPLTAQFKLDALWNEAAAIDASLLLAAYETLAREEGAQFLKLEITAALQPSLRWLADAGFVALPGPAGDQAAGAATGYAKSLAGNRPPPAPAHYRQTTAFTCGPCTLGSALETLGVAPAPERAAEIQLWREATTVHAPAGPGGCDTFGLAVAAMKRGLLATVYSSALDAILLNRANSEEKRELMRFVQEAFRREAAALGATIHHREFALAELTAEVEAGALVIILIDERLMHQEGAPHWLLWHGLAEGCALVNDPWIDSHIGESWIDAAALPIPLANLDRMAWYGDPAYRCALVLRRAGQ